MEPKLIPLTYCKMHTYVFTQPVTGKIEAGLRESPHAREAAGGSPSFSERQIFDRGKARYPGRLLYRPTAGAA